jgi:hypothetical protein
VKPRAHRPSTAATPDSRRASRGSEARSGDAHAAGLTWASRSTAYAFWLLFTALMLAILHQQWPRIGFDWSYFLPRLVDVHLHYLCSGVSVQWYTPSFGGGLPGFPNPQHTQFTIAALLLPLTDPWVATVLQYLLPASLGYLILIKFCLESLRMSSWSSIVAASIFSTNSFLIIHELTGHLSCTTFSLLAVIPLCLSRRIPAVAATVIFAGAGSLILVGGGHTIIIAYVLTAGLLAAGLVAWDDIEFPAIRAWVVAAAGTLLIVLICAAKIVAVGLFMAQFHRDMEYRHPAHNIFSAMLSIPSGLFVYKPMWLADRAGMDLVSRWLHKEFPAELVDYGMSPAALLLAPIGLFIFLRRLLARASITQLVLVLGTIWITVDFTLGRGIIWPLIKPLPLARALHENPDFGSAFILPLSLLSGVGLECVFSCVTKGLARHTLTACLLAISLISILPFRSQTPGFWYSGFDSTETLRNWRSIRNGERFVPITKISDVRDAAVFSSFASSWKPYDAMFGYGYGGPSFKTRLVPGPIDAPGQASLNFNLPTAFFFPSRLGQVPFQPAAIQDGPQVNLLLNRIQPDWRMPLEQRVGNVISAAAMVACLTMLASAAITRRSPRTPQPSA